MWRTRTDFEADFFASYRKSGLQRARKIVPMGSVLIGEQARIHKTKLPRKVSIALSVLDDLILDAILWHHLLVMLFWGQKPTSTRFFNRAMMALFMRVVQDAIVVRNLIQTGYDAQAKSLLRSIDEHADAIYYLCLRPAEAERFTLTNDDESANRFWWEHFRKSRKIIDEALLRIVKNEHYVREIVEFRMAERASLSAAHHPSYTACTIPFFVPYKSMSETQYMFGSPGEASYRTGKLLFYILAELAILVGRLSKRMNRFIGRDSGNVLQQVVREGRVHLSIMLPNLLCNWDAPLFAPSADLKRMMRELSRN
jgi:hypothetical protein